MNAFLALLLAAGAHAAPAYWSEWTPPPASFQRVANPVFGAPVADALSPAGAALELERSLRGRQTNAAAERSTGYDPVPGNNYYPDASPVPMDPDRIVEMTPALWTPTQLLADFKANGQGKDAMLVFLKTEYCHKNKFRLCAVATSSVNKATAPSLSRVRIYGAWLGHLNPKGSDPVYANWLEQVGYLYRFDQGPGSNFFVLIPDETGSKLVRAVRSDAARLELFVPATEASGGQTPKLEQFLQAALSR